MGIALTALSGVATKVGENTFFETHCYAPLNVQKPFTIRTHVNIQKLANDRTTGLVFNYRDGGNFYCFDTRVKTNGGSSNPIVFWYSSYKYTEADPPEIVCLELAEYIESSMSKNHKLPSPPTSATGNANNTVIGCR